MKLIHLIIAIALVVSASVAHASVSNREIHCGIGDHAKEKIVKITTQIPFISSQDDPNFFFGCTIKSINSTFTVHMVISAPDPNPKSLRTNVGYTKTSSENTLVIKTSPVTFTDFTYVSLTLDETDREGDYILDIFIDNILLRTVTFNVGR